MAKKQKILVRHAEPRDVVNICKLLQQGWNEQTTEYAPVDDLRGYKWILSILEEGRVAVADLNGRIVGAICASPFVPPWSLQWMLDVEFLYVMPAFRGERIAETLMDSIEKFADEVNLTLIFGMQTGDRPHLKDRMMKQAGWEYVGGNFLRTPSGQKQAEDD